jgi:hypothetical protein
MCIGRPEIRSVFDQTAGVVLNDDTKFDNLSVFFCEHRKHLHAIFYLYIRGSK